MRKTSQGAHTVTCDYKLTDDCAKSTTIEIEHIGRRRRTYIRKELTERGWDRSTLGDVCPNCKELLEQHDL